LASLAAAKRLELVTTISDDAEIVMTDRRALQQILLNLTDNAIKYTDTGSVRIDIVETTFKECPAVEMRVTDTGIGIQPADVARLFEPFEQLDPSNTRRFQGTGLGLYLSRRLAQLLGGKLDVRSELGKGSIFTLTLPR
ncbi:MAG: hypothetical protein JOY69_04910, partial [Candidatus Eremiobacteraeota bacterium]|nr:hypothetical protein [Candidatus Eremiobacteraeota bacterium]